MKYWPLPLLLLGACSGGDKGTTPTSPHNPTPYALDVPAGFPIPEIPADNPLTIEGIELGRLPLPTPSSPSTARWPAPHATCANPPLLMPGASAKESTA